MEFISIDLIGEFYPPTSKGHRYALTVMGMLTGFVFCASLKSKKAEEIVQVYLNKSITGLEDQGRFCPIMARNLKTRCLKKCQRNLDVK